MLFTTASPPVERLANGEERTRLPSQALTCRCQCGTRLPEDPEAQLQHVRTAHPNMTVQVRKDQS